MTIRTLSFRLMLLGLLFCSAAAHAAAGQRDWHAEGSERRASSIAISGRPGLQRFDSLYSAKVPRLANRRIADKAGRSMSEAIAIARARVPGELVSASKKVGRGGEVVYHVKILSRNGVVRTVRVPANSN